jgi:hypothetical protein
VPSRVGPLPAWRISGTDSTWAVFVHGRGATRAEVLRMLPAYRALGLPCLILSYRNDIGAPRVGDGSYRLGYTEWQDSGCRPIRASRERVMPWWSDAAWLRSWLSTRAAPRACGHGCRMDPCSIGTP